VGIVLGGISMRLPAARCAKHAAPQSRPVGAPLDVSGADGGGRVRAATAEDATDRDRHMTFA
jgi:hypothetical protein